MDYRPTKACRRNRYRNVPTVVIGPLEKPDGEPMGYSSDYKFLMPLLFFQQYAENKKLALLVREISCKYKKISL
jgi:hypothetical protein